MMPLLMSSAMPIAVVAAAKTMVWAKMPGHQELAVVDRPHSRERDRAAEDEREQQHEHDRLEDREDRQLRDARDALEVAPHDDQPVAEHRPKPPAGRRRPCAVAGGHAAASAIGSLLGDVAGQAQEDVVERRPAQADVVDLDARLVEVADDLRRAVCAPPSTATVSRRVCSSSDAVADADRAEDLDCASVDARPGRGRRPRSARRRPAP